MTSAVLVFMFRGAHILLAMKKRGFGEGKWNGPGGKVQFGENAKAAAMREVQEEIGVTPVLSEPLGELLYHDSAVGNWKVTVFRTEDFSGEPIETEEMKPQWFPLDTIPYKQMWNGDDKWLPLVIENKKFQGEMWLDKDQKISKADIRKV